MRDASMENEVYFLMMKNPGIESWTIGFMNLNIGTQPIASSSSNNDIVTMTLL